MWNPKVYKVILKKGLKNKKACDLIPYRERSQAFFKSLGWNKLAHEHPGVNMIDKSPKSVKACFHKL